MPETAVIDLLRTLSDNLPHSTVVILDPLIRDAADSKASVDGFLTQLSQGFKQGGRAHPRSHLINTTNYMDLFQNQHLHWRHFSCLPLVEALQAILTDEERDWSLSDSGIFDEFSALSFLRQRYIVIIASHSPEVSSSAFPSVLFIDKEKKAAMSATDVSLSQGYAISPVVTFSTSIANDDDGGGCCVRIERVDVFSNGPDTLLTETTNLIETVCSFVHYFLFYYMMYQVTICINMYHVCFIEFS
jgi:hypothetical protein